MFVVLDDETERGLLEAARSLPASGPVALNGFAATLNLAEDLISLGREGQSPGFPQSGAGITVGCYLAHNIREEPPSFPAIAKPTAAKSEGGLRVLLLEVVTPESGEEMTELRAIYFPSASEAGRVCETEVVRLDTGVFSRMQGILDTRVLAPKIVSVFGVGSLGSIGALEIAKAGVGNFNLVDFDRLRAHNISRHVCGLADVGRYKTRALRDAILQHNPRASVVCHQFDVIENNELLEQVIQSSDLVFVATGNEPSRYLINDACLAMGKPAVYGSAYQRALTGEVIRVVPGEAGCYACARQGPGNTMRSIEGQGVLDKTDDSELQAEPGLGMDVSFIALIHAKLALMTLLRGTASDVGDIDAEMIIWTNSPKTQDSEPFQGELTRHLVRVAKIEGCPACGEGSDGHASPP